MKKLRFLSAVMATVLLLLLLSACQPVPGNPENPTSSTPSSGVTPPSSSIPPTVPTTQPTVPTTQPSPAEGGHVLIFYGPPNQPSPDWWPTEGLIDHLYWVVEATKESILICDEPVVAYTSNDTHIFFVKESEPTKVYATPIGNFKNHELLYESVYGSVSSMVNYSNSNNLLQFVANGKKFVVYDMATRESTVLMEQYHINFAVLYCNDDGTWTEIINFEGQATETDGLYTEYVYNWVTGELQLGDPDCNC